jgi:hypothetical protein
LDFSLIDEGDELDQVDLSEDVLVDESEVALGFN